MPVCGKGESMRDCRRPASAIDGIPVRAEEDEGEAGWQCVGED
jgi:hypothetical protein